MPELASVMITHFPSTLPAIMTPLSLCRANVALVVHQERGVCQQPELLLLKEAESE